MQYKISDFNNRQVLPELRMSGIYQIKDRENRIYVGSTINSFRRRWYIHRNQLTKQKHHSRFLQNVYDKCGEDFITFSILEIVEDRNKILGREQYWIDTLKPEFNTLALAGNSLGYKFPEDLRIKSRNSKRDKIKQSTLGVRRLEKYNKFQAVVRVENYTLSLGYFTNYEEALAARLKGVEYFWSKDFDEETKEERLNILAKFRIENNAAIGKTMPEQGINKKRSTNREKQGENLGIKTLKHCFEASICIDGRAVYLGRYLEKQDAISIRKEAEKFYLSEDLRAKSKEQRMQIIDDSVKSKLFSSKSTVVTHTTSPYGKYIHKKDNSNSYNFYHKPSKHRKTFPTLDQAISYRDNYLSNLQATKEINV